MIRVASPHSGQTAVFCSILSQQTRHHRSDVNTIMITKRLLASSLAVLVVSAVVVRPTAAQRRVVEDTSSVRVTTRTAKKITRGPSRVATAQAATNGVLVVLTDPPGAAVAIDGAPAGKSDAAGEFQKELRAGRAYVVKVSAGPEFTPVTETIRLAAKQTEIFRAPLTNVNAGKFGLLKIGPMLEGAKIYVDDAKAPWANVTIDREEGLMLVDGLPPGKRKVRVDHPDYVIVEKNLAAVRGGEEYYWVFKPEFATVPMKVSTDPGTSIYIDGDFQGDSTENGILEVKDVRIGTHEVKLVKDGYVEYKETRAFDFGKPVDVAHRLVPLPTSAEFSDDFDVNLMKWAQPAGWKLATGRLAVVNCVTLGSAKGITYRDFVMAFHLKLEDGRGAAWAVRAKDPNNYYLFYLSGPKGLFPNRFSTYVVKDGKLDPTNPVQSVPVITNLTVGGQYQIEIRGTKDVIEHTVTPTETGRPEPLGVFQDPDKTFLYGGIGFRSVGPEQFSIDELYVQPVK